MNRERHCAFLTMQDTAGWSIDADLAVAPLASLGWTVHSVAWRAPVADWSRFAAVYIGTPWDYPEDPAGFLDLLERIEASGARLVNPLPLVRWNLEKTYLRDLAGRGADIVPTVWQERLTPRDTTCLFRHFDAPRIIVKPVISTNAHDTFLLAPDMDGVTRDALQRTFATRACMIQPFIEGIASDGEYSLFYIGGDCSHAIRKVPKPADFRVQEEHGATITAIEPDAELLDAARRVMALVEPVPLYARIDFVRGADARLLLMELELIEPSLYLRMHDDAPARFAAAFDAYIADTVDGRPE